MEGEEEEEEEEEEESLEESPVDGSIQEENQQTQKKRKVSHQEDFTKDNFMQLSDKERPTKSEVIEILEDLRHGAIRRPHPIKGTVFQSQMAFQSVTAFQNTPAFQKVAKAKEESQVSSFTKAFNENFITPCIFENKFRIGGPFQYFFFFKIILLWK